MTDAFLGTDFPVDPPPPPKKVRSPNRKPRWRGALRKAKVADLKAKRAAAKEGRTYEQKMNLGGGMTAAEYREFMASTGGSRRFTKWGTARKTVVNWHGTYVTFPSQLEAHVAARLLAEEAATPGARLYRQVSVPLLTIAPRKNGIPFRFACDFVMVYPNGTKRWIEAKGNLRSRDYSLRKAAAEVVIGWPIEEIAR